MSSRGALTLFHSQGRDTKGQTGRIRYKPRLNTHFKAPSMLCTAKTFSPTSLQAKELHHINAASLLPGPSKSWGHSRLNQHIHPAPAQSVTVLTSHPMSDLLWDAFSLLLIFHTYYTCRKAGFSEEPGSLEWGMLSSVFLLAIETIFI